MKKLLWLDDIRNPHETNLDGIKHWLVFSPIQEPYEVYWVKSYNEFITWIERNGIPDGICFDHDLESYVDGIEKTGFDCAKWLVEYCMDNDCVLPLWNVQSANPVGKENINGLMFGFKEFVEREGR